MTAAVALPGIVHLLANTAVLQRRFDPENWLRLVEEADQVDAFLQEYQVPSTLRLHVCPPMRAIVHSYEPAPRQVDSRKLVPESADQTGRAPRLPPGVSCIPLPMHASPLRAVNAYVLEGDGGYILVDCGWDTPDVLEALRVVRGPNVQSAVQNTTCRSVTRLADHRRVVGWSRFSFDRLIGIRAGR